MTLHSIDFMDSQYSSILKSPAPVTLLSYQSNSSPTTDLNGSDNTSLVCDIYGFTGGEQYCISSTKDIDKNFNIIKESELKWMHMFDNWSHWMLNNFYRLRSRCRKGIPMSMRALAWQYLSGSIFYMRSHSGSYSTFLQISASEEVVCEIAKDVDRQFPNHVLFIDPGGSGQQALTRILRVYSLIKPDVGYSQAQAPIAASLLIHMKEEEAFWTYLCINEFYLAHNYDADMKRYKIECTMLKALLRKYLPRVHEFFELHNVDILPTCVDWFMCLFTRNLPWNTVLRILDQFFCEGIKVIFRVSLAIFELLLEEFRLMNQQDIDSVTILIKIRKLSPNITTEDSMKFAESITKEELSTLHLQQRENLYKRKEIGETKEIYYIKEKPRID